MLGISINGKLTRDDWPMLGTLRSEPVRCFYGGQWTTLHPQRYQVVDIGVDEDHAAINRERNGRRKRIDYVHV